MEVITNEQALETALAIAGDNPPQRVFPTPRVFCEHVRTYFPEFSGFEKMEGFYFMRYYKGAAFKLTVQEESIEPGNDRPDFYVFDVERAVKMRRDLYAVWFSYCEDAIADDLFELLSFGAEPPSDRDELAERCYEMSLIWAGFSLNWYTGFADMKVGNKSSIVSDAMEAGIDTSIDAYMQGVPLEYIAHDDPFLPF